MLYWLLFLPLVFAEWEGPHAEGGRRPVCQNLVGSKATNRRYKKGPKKDERKPGVAEDRVKEWLPMGADGAGSGSGITRLLNFEEAKTLCENTCNCGAIAANARNQADGSLCINGEGEDIRTAGVESNWSLCMTGPDRFQTDAENVTVGRQGACFYNLKTMKKCGEEDETEVKKMCSDFNGDKKGCRQNSQGYQEGVACKYKGNKCKSFACSEMPQKPVKCSKKAKKFDLACYYNPISKTCGDVKPDGLTCADYDGDKKACKKDSKNVGLSCMFGTGGQCIPK